MIDGCNWTGPFRAEGDALIDARGYGIAVTYGGNHKFARAAAIAHALNVQAAIPAMLAAERARALEEAAAICAEAAEEASEDSGCGWAASSWLKAASRDISALAAPKGGEG